MISMSSNKLENQKARENTGNSLLKLAISACMSARRYPYSSFWDRSQQNMMDALPTLEGAPAGDDTTGRSDRMQAESGFYDGA
jgi:hypothetical protein